MGWNIHEFYKLEHRVGQTLSLSDCTVIELPKISDNRGNLSFVESEEHVPFEIKRVYTL